MSRVDPLTSYQRIQLYIFCAEWCGVCRGLRESVPTSVKPCLNWIDIEEDGDLVGDLEIENFPTIAIWRDGRWVFHGVVKPYWEPMIDMLTSAEMHVEKAVGLTLSRMRAKCR